MNQKKKQRSPEQIIKLYNRIWNRAVKSDHPPFSNLKPKTLTARCIVRLTLPMARIREAMKSKEYMDTVTNIIHSN